MSERLKAFFGCSMRGGQALVSRENLQRLKDGLRELGIEFVSEHQTQPGIIAREDEITPLEIHDRDWAYGAISKIGIFEISNPSLGVGAEISDLIHMGIPVICLYSADVPESSISAYIRGKQGSSFVGSAFACCAYSSVDNAKELVADFIRQYL